MAILILTEQDLAELTKKFGDFYDKLTLSVLSRASPADEKGTRRMVSPISEANIKHDGP